MLSNVKVEAGFSKAYQQYLSKDTTPVTEATSSWDSDSDAEIVGTIHTKEDPWFFVEERCVLLKTKLDDVIDDFEEACDDDTPLSFRPFMNKAIQGLRKDLAERLTTEFLLSAPARRCVGSRTRGSMYGAICDIVQRRPLCGRLARLL